MEHGQDLPLWDIYEVAWLDHNNIHVTTNKQGGRVVFGVPPTDETYALLREYQEGPMVALLDYVRSLRRTRARMLDARDGNGRRETETGYGRNR